MKNLGKVMGVLLVLSCLGLSAQVPQKIAYQAVLRNADGTVMASQQVELQVVLHKTTANGDVVYSETHTKTTTNQGLVTFEIGAGTVNSGAFNSIAWTDPIFIELLVKKSGQTSFTALGASQIVSVPYAFLAEKSLTANNGISGTGSMGNTVYSNGQEWSPTARVSVMDSTVIISPGAGHDPDKPIFAVTNSQGQVVMAVYETGVRFNVDGSGSKGAKGGFAVGGLTSAKAPAPTYFQLEPAYAQFLFDQSAITKGAKGGFAVGGLTNAKGDTLTYMTIHPDSIRFAFNDNLTKGAKGGFAVGGLTSAKAPAPTYFQLEPAYAQFLFDQSAITKGAKGGFAVGGLTNAKGDTLTYMTIHPDSTRFAFNDNLTKGAKGGFAVGGLTNAKSGSNVYMSLLPDNIRFAFDDSNGKGAKGGFAVGGLTNAKASTTNYFEVTPDSTYIVNTMVSYSDMVVAGNVTTNVGLLEPPIVDTDGITYQTVKIGTQVWMAENLRATTYSDGTPVDPLHMYSYPDPDSLLVFGNLYSDSVVIHSGKNICPDGWHVPTHLEWETMFTFVAGAGWTLNSENLGKKIIEPYGDVYNGIYNWIPDQGVLYATNETGFSARGAGSASWVPASSYWTSYPGYSAHFWVINDNIEIVAIENDSGSVSIMEGSTGNAYSVRCVKN
ncbi:MAG TPA: hypothetical protein ENN49_00530 [Bacteroidales bacterium]|nr:hypothetical protein [Bacteroidales bacterium]